MKNPIAYAVWFVAILFATLILIAGFKEGGANNNVFLIALYLFILRGAGDLEFNLVKISVLLRSFRIIPGPI